MINKLVENIKKTGAPIVVGLDPMMKFIPSLLQKGICGIRRNARRCCRSNLAVQ